MNNVLATFVTPSSGVVFREAAGYWPDFFYAVIGSILVFCAFFFVLKLLLEHKKAFIKGGLDITDFARLLVSSLFIVSFMIYMAQ